MINSGDNVYIYGTHNINSFSIDIEKQYFKFVNIKKTYNSIYIGKLKDNIEPGTEIMVNLYYENNSKDFQFKIVPKFVSILFDKRNLILRDTLTCKILFNDYKNMTNGNGVDSIFLIINKFGEYMKSKNRITVFKNDSFVNYDYASGIFPVNIPFLIDTGHYMISLIIYSNEMFDTLYNCSGFTVNYENQNNSYNNIIIDTDNYDEMLNIYQNIFQSNINFYFTFFSGIENIYNNNAEYNCFLIGQSSVFINDFINLITEKDRYIIIFYPDFKDLLKDSIIKDSISKLTGFTIDTNRFMYYDSNYISGFEINKNYNAYYYLVDSIYLYFTFNNVFIFSFMPEYIDFDIIKRLIENHKNILKHKLLCNFNTVETLQNNGYNNYNIEFYTIYGKFLCSLILNFVYTGDIVIDINQLAENNNIKENIVFYKIMKDGECIKKGILLK